MILSALRGALAYRIRGGLHKDFLLWFMRKILKKNVTMDDIAKMKSLTTLGRLAWAVAVAYEFWRYRHDVAISLIAGALAFGGTLHGYWGKFDLLKPENRNIKNYIALTGASLLRILYLFLFFLIMSEIWGVFAGYTIASAFGLIAAAPFVFYYLLGVRIHKICPKIGHSQYGEILTGLAILTAIRCGFEISILWGV